MMRTRIAAGLQRVLNVTLLACLIDRTVAPADIRMSVYVQWLAWSKDRMIGLRNIQSPESVLLTPQMNCYPTDC